MERATLPRRRFVIGSLGIAMLPVFAGAPAGRRLVIGVLVATSEAEARTREYLEAALRRLGYVDGRDVTLELRYADNHYEQLEALARDLVARKADVILAGGTPPMMAARKATSTIPIIAVGATNLVTMGVADSLAHPGRNVTGVVNMAAEAVTKGVEFLRMLAPHAKRVGFLANPDNPASALPPERTERLSKAYGVTVVAIDFRSPADLERELDGAHRGRVDALYARLDATLNANAHAIARFALSRRLPTMGSQRQFVAAGGLASYGHSSEEMWNSAAQYVDRIAHGARAGDLPIIQPTRFELALNRATAAALGVAIPESMRVLADFVVD